jgi:hypothetical protein
MARLVNRNKGDNNFMTTPETTVALGTDEGKNRALKNDGLLKTLNAQALQLLA